MPLGGRATAGSAPAVAADASRAAPADEAAAAALELGSAPSFTLRFDSAARAFFAASLS